jgi:hypothetical protein
MKQVFGGILIAIGVLIAGGSGLCSLMVLFSSGEMSGFGMWPAVLLFGGVPFAAGVGMIFAGRALILSARQDDSHNPGGE